MTMRDELLLINVRSSQQQMSFHIWDGKLVLYNGNRTTDLYEAKELCQGMSGQLPSVHSEADVTRLKTLISRGASIWLGAEDISRYNLPFHWMDGSLVDYQKWTVLPSECSSIMTGRETRCCGLVFATPFQQLDGFAFQDCHTNHQMVCVIDQFTEELNNQISETLSAEFNDTLKQHEQKIILLTRLNDQVQRFLQVDGKRMMNSFNKNETQVFEGYMLVETEYTRLKRAINGIDTKLMPLYNIFYQNLRKSEQEARGLQQMISKLQVNASGIGLSRDRDDLSTATHELHEKIKFCFLLIAFCTLVLLIEPCLILFRKVAHRVNT